MSGKMGLAEALQALCEVMGIEIAGQLVPRLKVEMSAPAESFVEKRFEGGLPDREASDVAAHELLKGLQKLDMKPRAELRALLDDYVDRRLQMHRAEGRL